MAPKRSAPLPPPAASSGSEDSSSGSGSDESGDEEDTAPSQSQAPAVPIPKQKMPLPKLAPNQEAEGKGAKPSPSIQDKKRGAPFQRTWSTGDEVRILEALAAHRLEHGKLPRTDALAAALAGSLDKSDCSQSELERKVKSLRSRYSVLAKKGELKSRDHGRRLFDLSKSVWGYRSRAEANGVARREISEVYKLYPYLAEEVRALEKARPGLFKRELEMVDDGKAQALNAKIKKQRQAQMKVYQHHYDLIKEVTKTLIDLDNQGK